MDLIHYTENEIKTLAEKLYALRKTGINRITIIQILNDLIPETEKEIIQYNIDNTIYPICFNADNATMYISIEKLNKTIINSIKVLKRIFPNMNEYEMINYYILFALTHEIRHINQYLIAIGEIEAPYQIVKEVYQNMFKLGNLNTNPLRNFVSEYLYNLNNERFIMERNANIEASEILRNLAIYEGNK